MRNSRQVAIGPVKIGGGAPLALIAGPCVIESADLLFEIAGVLKPMAERLGLGLVFKASFDKANRTSLKSFRGAGFESGLKILAEVKARFQVPVISDIHEAWQAGPAAEVLDALQIPALLSRQTSLLTACAATGKPVNLKKGQFMAPQDMALAAAKLENTPGFGGLMLCERGVSFGYHNLVVDMRSLPIMARNGWPVIFDATHSVQLPAAGDGRSEGEREFIPVLARAAVAAGLDGLFMETHPRPGEAKCDGPNSWPLSEMEGLLSQLLALHQLTSGQNYDFGPF